MNFHTSQFPKVPHLFARPAGRAEGVPLQRQAPAACATHVEAAQDAVGAQHQAAAGDGQRRGEEGGGEAEEPLAHGRQAEILGTWGMCGQFLREICSKSGRILKNMV